MSTGGGRDPGVSPEDVTAFFRDWWHLIALAAGMAFMFWVRLLPIDRFRGSEDLRLQAVDSYYHWRSTEWTAENFPYTMPYEIFTSYPTGRYVGQFGTLFDQLIALLAFIIGLGDPSRDDILLAALVGVPLMAALVAIPVYKMGERLGGRLGGLTSLAILALSPGVFFRRSVTGMFQHHVAEVLFMALTVWLLMVAIRLAEREQPVYELLVDRAWDALKRPVVFAALPGIALMLYIWVWPPALMMIGILGIFFVVAILLEHLRGRSPEPIVFVGAICLGIVVLFGVILAERRLMTTSNTTFSYFQPFLALCGVLGFVALGWLSREWESRSYSQTSYAIGVAGVSILGLAALWVVFPSIIDTIVSNFTRRIVPFGDPGTDVTIAEASPPPDPATFMYEQFGFAYFTMIAGLVLLAARPFYGRPYRVEHTLIIVWSVFLISMSLTQLRFNYYLILPVAVVNAYLVALVVEWMDLPSLSSFREIEGYQVLTIAVVFMVLFAPLLPPMAATTVVDAADQAFPSNDAEVWGEANEFLETHTPSPGDWGPHENSEQLDYFGTYQHPGNGFEYPEGTYGVLTWWDYGHLITTQAERIPHSNPFQSNAQSSAVYLLSDSEERAELVLEAIEAQGDGVSILTNDELRAIIDEGDADQHDMRYVMVEDQMVATKFGAKTQWADEDPRQYFRQDTYQFQGQNETLPERSDAYHETMLVRLYLHDGDGLEHYRLVHETAEEYSIVGNLLFGQNRESLLRLNSHLGMGASSWADVAQLDFALRQANANNQVIEPFGTGTGIFAWDSEIQPAVKTFERVDGATIAGEVPNGSTVHAQVTLNATTTERIFGYTQSDNLDNDGSFALTVPYATSEELGVADGYTDSTVTTVGNYTITVTDEDGEPLYQGHAEVSETAIYDGDRVEVELDPYEPDEDDETEDENGEAEDEDDAADQD